MKKNPPHINITVQDFYTLVLDSISSHSATPLDDKEPREVFFENYIVDNDLDIDKGTSFKNLSFPNVSICFTNCRLGGIYHFENVKFRFLRFVYTSIDVVNFIDSTFETLEFVQPVGLGLNINKCSFYQFISIRDGIIKNSILLNEVYSKGQIGLNNIDSKTLSISKCTSNLNLYSGSFNSVRLINNNFLEAHIFSLNNRPLSTLTPLLIKNDKEYKYGSLEIGGDFNTDLIIKGNPESYIEIGLLKLSDSIITNKTLTIDHVQLNTLIIKNIINTGNINFYNIKATGTTSAIFIESSSLGKTDFFKIDFKLFKTFNVIGSDLKNINYNNVFWPININESDAISKVEIYKQLKNNASKNNDLINSVKFYSIEKHSYYKALKWNWRDIEDKLIFFFNLSSNNSNQSWLKPILLNLIIQLFIFLFIGFSVSLNNFHLNEEMLINFLIPIPKFLFLINPAFSISELSTNENLTQLIKNNDVAIVLITISRLISAYLIYQTIAAFRRFQ